MSPLGGSGSAGSHSFPRVSGDEPRQAAQEGEVRRFPRVSGDEPKRNEQNAAMDRFSPRERG